MLVPRGDKDDKGLTGKLADVLRQQHPVQRRNIDIQKNGVDPVVLKVFQYVQPVLKGADDLHLAVFFNKPAQLLLREYFIFHNDDFHGLLSPGR